MHFNQLFIYTIVVRVKERERVSEKILRKGKSNATVQQLV